MRDFFFIRLLYSCTLRAVGITPLLGLALPMLKLLAPVHGANGGAEISTKFLLKSLRLSCPAL